MYVFLFILLMSLNIVSNVSLPHCSEKQESVLFVSTLDGKLSALQLNGSVLWELNTGPGPQLSSYMEFSNNTEWKRIIPALTGTLYKFDGSAIDPIPISPEDLLKSSLIYSEHLVIAGGIEVRIYGVGLKTGTIFYHCDLSKCSHIQNINGDILVVERSSHIVRAVEPVSGREIWNFSVGLVNIKLSRVQCINVDVKSELNFSAVIPEGKLYVSFVDNNTQHNQQYLFPAPIVKIWKWTGKNLPEVDIFSIQNIPEPVRLHRPSIYLGMYMNQFYIQESKNVRAHVINFLNESDKGVMIIESTCIPKTTWNPVVGSNKKNSTALALLNGSKYNQERGFFMYGYSNVGGNFLHESGNSCSKFINFSKIDDDSTFLYWGHIFILISTFVILFFCIKYIYAPTQGLTPKKLLKAPTYNCLQRQESVLIEPSEADDSFCSSRGSIVKIPLVTDDSVSLLSRELVLKKSSEAPVPHINVNADRFVSYLEENFEIIQRLGRGGYGVVYEVKKKIDECKYAIKRITLPNEKVSREKVLREVKALANLSHENIVRYFNSWEESPPVGWQPKKALPDASSENTIFTSSQSSNTSKSIYFPHESSNGSYTDVKGKETDQTSRNKTKDKPDSDDFIVFENGNSENLSSNHNKKQTVSSDLSFSKLPDSVPCYLYIQMQLCQKESLRDWLVNNQTRSTENIHRIFIEILNAVEYIHSNNLIHRDLKPSNIFFSADGKIKVGDFGLVKSMTDVFDLKSIKNTVSSCAKGHTLGVGTELYRSPEQSQNRNYDYKVDIYSLGLILFELLVPFSTGMERVEVLNNVKEGKYPKDFSKKFSEEYNLLQMMICEDPNERYTMTMIKARFNTILQHFKR